MSFSVWNTEPPFTLKPEEAEQIYRVGAFWVVTDDPSKATQTQVDAVVGPSAVKLAALNEFRLVRAQFLTRLDGMQASANTNGNAAEAQEIESIKTALKAIPQAVTLTGDAATMRAQLFAAWKVIRDGASTGVKVAFSGFDA
jgi:uncharacterized protein affecting Mg2+/Co2+ transport